MHERQHLPLWRVSQYSGCRTGGARRRLKGASMIPFTFAKAHTQREALDGVRQPGAVFIAGGTTLIDLMKLNVETPARLVDINRVPLDRIEAQPDGSLRVGAMVRNSDLAHHPKVEKHFPV